MHIIITCLSFESIYMVVPQYCLL